MVWQIKFETQAEKELSTLDNSVKMNGIATPGQALDTKALISP